MGGILGSRSGLAELAWEKGAFGLRREGGGARREGRG